MNQQWSSLSARCPPASEWTLFWTSCVCQAISGLPLQVYPHINILSEVKDATEDAPVLERTSRHSFPGQFQTSFHRGSRHTVPHSVRNVRLWPGVLSILWSSCWHIENEVFPQSAEPLQYRRRAGGFGPTEPSTGTPLFFQEAQKSTFSKWTTGCSFFLNDFYWENYKKHVQYKVNSLTLNV